MGRKQSQRLLELQAKLLDLDATIARCHAERQLLKEEITKERAAVTLEAQRARDGLVANVIARWDTDMTATEIAKAMRCSVGEVERILGTWRKVQGTSVRRGRQLEERRKLRG